VAANTEVWRILRDRTGLCSGLGYGHKRCRRKPSKLVQPENGSIDSGSQAKVIGVHDESFHSDECINSRPTDQIGKDIFNVKITSKRRTTMWLRPS